MLVGLWLLTLVEFGLRGLGREGLTGERDVENRLAEPGDERYAWRWPRPSEFELPLLCAYGGLALGVLVFVLTWAY